MEKVAGFLDEGVELAAEIKAKLHKDTGKNVSYKVRDTYTKPPHVKDSEWNLSITNSVCS